MIDLLPVYERLRLDYAGLLVTSDAQQVVIERQNVKIAELRAALQPFAHQARIIDENDKADGHGPEEPFAMFRFRNSYTAICLGDCRRAMEAL